VKNIVIKYAFLQGMLIPYSSQNGFIYLRIVHGRPIIKTFRDSIVK
jgi:hypothetical protein